MRCGCCSRSSGSSRSAPSRPRSPEPASPERQAAHGDVAAGIALVAPQTPADAPPLAMLKPNTVTTFANGQKWTIGPDGQPKQVP